MVDQIQCERCQSPNAIGVPFCFSCGNPLFKQAQPKKAAPAGPQRVPQPMPKFVVYGLEANQRVDDIVVILLPLANEPTKPQIEVFGNAMGQSLYEARLSLSRPLPQILAIGQFLDLRGFAEPLHQAELPIMLVSADKLTRPFQAWQVENIYFEPDRLCLIANNEQFDLDPNAEILMLFGRYEHSTRNEQTRPGTRRTSSLARGTARTAKKVQWQTERIDYVHLYHVDESFPFVFMERRIVDYSFLGADMKPASNLNFGLLKQRLAQLPFAKTNELLFKNSNLIAESFGSGKQAGTLLPVQATNDDSKSNESMANVLSMVLFQAWWGHCL